MSEEQNKDPILEKPTSRRDFLKNSGLTVGGLVLGGALGGTFLGKTETVTKEVEVEVPVEVQVPPGGKGQHQTFDTNDYTEAMQFFTRKEDFDTLAAATEVIFPEDEFGPGAIKLRAPFYIDKQLASPWGGNVEDYTVRPFKDGEIQLTRSYIMIQGIRKLNTISHDKYNMTFNNLKEDQQIAILKDFESDGIDMELVPSSYFFALLRQLTIEGCYCDPFYGGNKNMEGWKMKEFPGAYMSHIDVLKSNEFVYKEPRSLSGHLH